MMATFPSSSLQGHRRVRLAAALATPVIVTGCSPAPWTADAPPGVGDGDGEVSFEEYEAAVAAEIACIEAAGYEVDGPYESPSGRLLEFGVIVHHSSDEEEVMERERAERDQVARACHEEHAVTDEWIGQTQPMEQDEARHLAEFRACVAEAGVDLPPLQGLEDVGNFDERHGPFDAETQEQVDACGRVLADQSITTEPR